MEKLKQGVAISQSLCTHHQATLAQPFTHQVHGEAMEASGYWCSWHPWRDEFWAWHFFHLNLARFSISLKKCRVKRSLADMKAFMIMHANLPLLW